MRKLKLHYLLITLTIIFCFRQNSLLIAESNKYLESLQVEAEKQKLALDSQWLSLIHYKHGSLLNSYKSLADDQKFFLAGKSGKTDPKKELAATLQSFFQKEKSGELHPQCQFVARFAWLNNKLKFNQEHLKFIECEEFQDWYKNLNAASVSLIFPTAYLNNPASAFGHTLLRLNLPNQTKESALLAYSANYSAATHGENAILYAIKGIFGGYKGFFSVAPYYQLVNRYSDIESRDIWEYELNFTPEEVEILVKHLWELRSIAFDYYYFDENCSYHILALLDVARPKLQLINQIDTWVLPLDTVRVLREKLKLIGNADFRPSKASKLQKRINLSSQRARDFAHGILKTKALPDSQSIKRLEQSDVAQGLDLAYDFLSYKERFIKNQDNSNELLLGLLNQRSKIDVEDLEIDDFNLNYLPEDGHKSMRVSAGRGKRAGQYSQEFRIRPVYHSLLDAPKGYSSGAQIEFLDFNFALNDQGKVNLEKFAFVDIISLNNVNSFLAPISWSLAAGTKRSLQADGSRALASNLDLAFGKAYEFQPYSYLYALISSDLKASTHYQENYAFGNGVDLGVVWNHGEIFAEQVSFKPRRYYVGDSHLDLSLAYEQRVSLTKNLAVRFSVARERVFDLYQSSCAMWLDFYL